MNLNTDRRALLLVIYDKLIVGLVVGAATAAVIYSYNVYSKAFELAQAQSSGYSAIAAKLREIVVSNSTQATQKIQLAYDRGDRFFTKEEGDKINSLAIEIRNVSNLLQTKLTKTTAASKNIADALTRAATNFAVPGAFTKRSLEDFNLEVAKLQSGFIDEYDNQIGPLASTEFQKFFQSFQDQLPLYLQPQWLLAIVISSFIGGTIVCWWFLGSSDDRADFS